MYTINGNTNIMHVEHDTVELSTKMETGIYLQILSAVRHSGANIVLTNMLSPNWLRLHHNGKLVAVIPLDALGFHA